MAIAQRLHPGRPRDARLDDVLIEAAHKTFLERGYHASSLAEIARRAGIGTPALYRRWKSKADLAIAVVIKESRPTPLPNSGSFRRDLASFLRLRLRTFGSPLFQQVLLPVTTEAVSDPGLQARIRIAFLEYREPWIESRIREAVAGGELRRGTDPNRLVNLLMGTVAMPLLFSQQLPKESEAASIVDSLLDGFAPRPTARARRRPC